MIASQQSIALEYTLTASPILAYNAVDGVILGAALFYYPEKKLEKSESASLRFLANKDKHDKAIIDYKKLASNETYGFALSASFDNFDYAEYDDASSSEYQMVSAERFNFKPQILLPSSQHHEWSLFFDLRQRDENPIKNEQLSSDETFRYSIGMDYQISDLDDNLNPTSGSLQKISVSVLPSQNTLLSTAAVDIDLRHYYQLSKYIIGASRLSAGIYSAQPGYLFRYQLGGEEGLRGFDANRFYGKKFYLLQQELRFPIWRIVEGVAFVEAGEAASSHFKQHRTVTGLGVRIGLPPDFRMKLRVDYAFDDEQQSALLVNFGHFF